MSDPLAFLPLAIAAGGGHVDSFEVQQLVAGGLTLLQRSAPLVRALHRRRSAILLPTSPAFFTALAASEGRGAVLINPLAARPEIAYQIADGNVGAVFTVASLADQVPPNAVRVLMDDAPRTARVVADGVSRDIDLGTHHGLTLEGETDAPGAREEAAVVYTSALAGTLVGASLTHANLLSNARATVGAGTMRRDGHSLAVLPFSHLFGLVVSGAAPLLAGGRVTTMSRFNPARAIELLESEPVTDLIGVPAIFAAIVALLGRRGAALESERLRLCICGGAPLAIELQDRWGELTGVELRQGYGLTEAGPVCLFNRVDLPNRRGTLGVPFPGVRVSVRAEEPAADAEVTHGADGEICIAGPNVFSGYVNAAAHPRVDGEAWSGGLHRIGEWLRTGDRGAQNPDGTIAFRGVIKPMFTRNGFNIYPREIERVIGEMPGVSAVRVTAVPEPLRENDIAITVAGDVSAAAVKAWCDDRLAAYKRPSAITIEPGA
ncbi:MAG TPA: AMP-binding protein [Gemmatimonadaceae bacterium]|nr:AMP-binding protein [Gemmatimonadaceae bacterium]